MICRALIIAAVSYSLCPAVLHSQVQTISVPDTRWIATGGDSVYYFNQKDANQGIIRWAADATTTVAFPLEHVMRRVGRPLPLYSIAADASGQLFVCYVEPPNATGASTPRIVIGKTISPNTITEVWSNIELLPRRFVVARSGLIYVLGLTVERERQLLDPKNSVPVSANILHIVDPPKGVIKSLLPVTVQPGRKGGILAVLAGSLIAVRENGNFLPSFDPVSVQGEFDELSDATEYSSTGEVLRRHTYSRAPVGSVVSSIQIDRDDTLLIQYMTVLKHPTDLSFASHIEYGQSIVVRSASTGGSPSRLQISLPNNERLIGIRSTGQLLTSSRAKKAINLWNRD